MPDENLIGLSELIDQVKRELLSTSPDKEQDLPLLCVDSIELELQVTVKKEGKAGFKIYVFELGTGASRDDVQKVKVKLSSLFTREELLAIYKNKYPERWHEVMEKGMKSSLKGNDDPGF